MRQALLLAVSLLFLPLAGWAATSDRTELKMIMHEAEGNDPGAQLLYGLALLEGRYGLQPDAGAAVSWLQRSADGGNAYAELILGNCYAEGRGVAKDAAQAVRWWRKAAQAGNTEAQYRLGRAYLEGFGVAHDDARAIQWLRQAAENGNPHAQYLIGKMYHEGYIVAQDQTLARDWLSRAAAHGHTEAINLLALINTLVKTTTMVSRSAYTDLLEKAQAGDPQAQYELGLRYRSGALEDRVDPDKAMYWLRRAADNGNLLAMKTLAEIYAEGWMNVKKDAAKAAYWREKSAGRH